MSFGIYITLVTLGLLVLRWILFEFFERKADSPAFLWFMLDPNGHPQDKRIRWIVSFLFIALGGIGLAFFD